MVSRQRCEARVELLTDLLEVKTASFAKTLSNLRNPGYGHRNVENVVTVQGLARPIYAQTHVINSPCIRTPRNCTCHLATDVPGSQSSIVPEEQLANLPRQPRDVGIVCEQESMYSTLYLYARELLTLSPSFSRVTIVQSFNFFSSSAVFAGLLPTLYSPDVFKNDLRVNICSQGIVEWNLLSCVPNDLSERDAQPM